MFNIEKEETVDQLINAIKDTRENAGDIKLWKVNIPLAYDNNMKLNNFMNDPIVDARILSPTARNQQHSQSKDHLMIYLHESKVMVNWQAFRRRVLRERKIKRDLCKLREDLADQALKFGFIREKFIDWISSISAELLSTQTLEYWLLSYISETASSDANFWCEFISPRDWLLCCFDINIETAIAIVSGVSEDYLKTTNT
ncbi:unnamed protein product [Rhizophagus irregularis]|nr:unnamed protein product [Rhizophagus irregularis]